MEPKVCVVTVTYGNRFHLLKQVIEAVLKEGVCKVVVVDNNSEPESREKLRGYERELGNQKIKVLYLDDNYGSAGGFKRGLEEAYNDPDCEFIWLLDDDNKPMEGALKVLLDFWDSLEEENKEEKVALSSYRPVRGNLVVESILKNKPELILGRKNSFFGFHVKDLPMKTIKYLRSLLNLKKIEDTKVHNFNLKYSTIPSAPYGGLFIHKNLIDNIGFPNEKFYLYVDDTEWTYRITMDGGKIYLVLESIIYDLEPYWGIHGNFLIDKIPKDTKRSYYAFRNAVFFEINNLVDNKIVFWINVLVYMLIVFLFHRDISLIKVLIRAIKDAYKGNLGKIEDEW
jgi:GT2 family glycosyltransferase